MELENSFRLFGLNHIDIYAHVLVTFSLEDRYIGRPSAGDAIHRGETEENRREAAKDRLPSTGEDALTRPPLKVQESKIKIHGF